MPTLRKTPAPDPEAPPLKELKRLLHQAESARAKRGGSHRVELPDHAYRFLVGIVQDLYEGKLVSPTPVTQALTTQKAANLLGVSRQFLVRLLDDGKIRSHKVGTHRRIYLKDLLAFREERDLRRHEAIRRIARDAVDDGIYDEF